MNRWAVYEAVSGRTFLVFGSDAEDAKALVKLFLKEEPEARKRERGGVNQKRHALSATLAGSWEQVGFGPTGDVQRTVVGDPTNFVTLWDERKAPGA